MGRRFRVFPSIGVARVGDSKTEWYVGPESPNVGFVPEGGVHRELSGSKKIKRMAARFRIYEFDENDLPLREVTLDDSDIEAIEWEVHLANTKASKAELNEGVRRNKLIIDAGAVRIAGGGRSKKVDGVLGVANMAVRLGELKSEKSGRLLVLGGFGRSRSWNNAPVTGIQSNGWFDDVADGPVSAKVRVRGEEFAEQAVGAWVVVGPPDFAPPMQCVVTLYDLAQDRAAPFVASPFDVEVSFVRDIYPVLRRTVFLQWTSSSAKRGHGGRRGNFLDPGVFEKMHDKTLGSTERSNVVRWLKNPADPNGSGNMPKLAGLALTNLQYRCFERWGSDDFIDDWDSTWDPVSPPRRQWEDFEIKEQPEALTKAALDACVGGSFGPGIEVGEIVANYETYEEPFRISRIVRAGGLTHELSVPWQADFQLCTERWWPSARPDSVIRKGPPSQEVSWDRGVRSMQEMVDKWKKLGFVARDTDEQSVQYVETERTL